MIKVIAILFLLSPCLVLAQQSQLLCSQQGLTETLLSSPAKFLGTNKILNWVVSEAEEGKLCESTLKSFAKGRELLETGALERKKYLSFYTKHFPKREDQLLMLTPELEILRRTHSLFEAGSKKTSSAAPREMDIRRQALRETLSRYGLPEMGEGELEQMARLNPDLQPASYFFKKRQNALREIMSSNQKVQMDSPELFKTQLIEILQSLRIRNLMASMREVSKIRDLPLKFKDPLGSSGDHLMTLEEFLELRPRFINAHSDADQLQVLDIKVKTLELSSAGKVQARKDYENRLYEYAHLPLQKTAYHLRFKTLDDKVLEISEIDFRKILEALSPERPTDFFAEDSERHRFLLETTARDAQLANLVHFLSEKRDASTMDLYRRLNQRMKGRGKDVSKASQHLSLEINRYGNQAIDDSAASDLLWFGWGQHPQYWSIRIDQDARLGLDYYGEETGGGDSVFKKNVKKIRKKEVQLEKGRYVPDRTRQKNSLKKKASLAVLGAAALGFGQLLEPGNLKNPFEDLNLPSIGDFLSGILRSEGGQDFDSDFNHYNVKIPAASDQATDETLVKKQCGDSHDASSSPFAIEVVCDDRGIKGMVYYNFAKKGHIYDDFGYLRRDVVPLTEATDGEASKDLVVDVNIRNYASGSILGLVQIKDYKLSEVEVYDDDGIQVNPSKLEAFQVEGNRQIYLRSDEFISFLSKPYTLRLSYHHSPEIDRSNQIQYKISPENLYIINERLYNSGFTELAEQLESLESGGPVRLADLAQLFSSSATYTYSSLTWWKHWSGDPAFLEYTRYLDDEGRLHYQCTGSNQLLQTYLRELKLLGEASLQSMEITPLTGFFSNEDGGHLKRGAPGHRHTLVSNPRTYFEIDGTPYGAPPEEVKPNKTPLDLPKLKMQEGVLPNRPKLNFSNQEGESDEEERSESSPLSQDSILEPHSSKSSRLNRNQLDLIFKRLFEMRQRVLESAKAATLGQNWIKNQNFKLIPGLKFLPLSHQLMESYENLEHPEDAVRRLGYSFDDPILGLNHIFEDELRSLQSSLQRLSVPSEGKESAFFEFLLYDPLNSRLKALANYLDDYSWADLLLRSIELEESENQPRDLVRSANKSCESYLKE